MRIRPSALVVVAALAMSAQARAELPRVVVVLDETMDGKKAATSAAEVALTSSLMKDGYRVVSGEMADKLRKNQAVSLALSGSVPPELSSLDADIVILGQVEVVKIGTIPDVGLIGYRSGVVAKLIRVDTAQIVDAISTEGKGQDFAEASAAQKSQKSAGEELAKQIKSSIASLAKKPQPVDLVVHGIPDRAQVDAVKGALSSQRGVSNVVVRQSGKGLTKIEVTVLGDADSLASQLEKGGLPLEIIQVSASSILARFDPKRGVRLGALIMKPNVGKLAARGKWLESALPKLVEAEMSNLAFMDPVESGGDVVIALTVVPAAKNTVQLSVDVLDGATKDKLYSTSATGELEAMPDLVSKAIANVDSGLFPALAKAKGRSGKGPAEALAKAATIGKQKKQQDAAMPVDELRIESLKLENVFPAKLGYYTNNPVGILTVVHTGAHGQAAENVKVSAYVPRFTQLATDIEVGSLKPGERREVPIKLTLDSGAVFALEENTPTQAEVIVEYTVAGGKMSARRVAPLVVYGRRAIDWSEETPIVAFVTPQEEVVRTFARGALAPAPTGTATSAPLPEPLAEAVAMFQAMTAAELKYVKDPVLPAASGTLDSVQFPRETLTNKSGDCDDLSVLFASLLESVGVETAFLLVPGHVLVAVGAGVPPDAIERVTVDEGKMFVHDGKTYIPVETTLMGKPFRDAWAAGAEQVARAQKDMAKDKNAFVVVSTREGWARFPPAALPRAAGLNPPKVDAKKSGAIEELARVTTERDAGIKNKLDMLAKATTKDAGGKDALAYAELLAKTGDVTKARSVLDAALKKDPKSVGAQNNLANIEVLSGNAAGAAEKYISLLDASKASGDSNRGELLTNLGIAYASVGDKEHAAQAFDAALNEGAVALFLATGFERAPTQNGKAAVDTSKVRAADDARLTVAEQDLKSALQKALEKRKAAASAKGADAGKKDGGDRFANPLPSGARRGDDPQSKLRTAELLRWM